MLRNEYVHASNLQAFNSMQHFYIKQILPNVFDEFFRALNVKIKKYVEIHKQIRNIDLEQLSSDENLKSYDEKILNLLKKYLGSIEIKMKASDQGVIFDVFSDLLNKAKLRQTVFDIISKGVKLKNGGLEIKTSIDEQKISKDKFILNILKNNYDLFREYKDAEKYLKTKGL